MKASECLHIRARSDCCPQADRSDEMVAKDEETDPHTLT